MAIDARFFTINRARLTEVLKGGLVVVSAYKRMQRSNDIAHTFEQESNFWYLCGIEEPEWLLICDGRNGKSWLVEPEIDTTHKIFDGTIAQSAASDRSGIKTVLTHDEGLKLLRSLTRYHSVCYTVDQPSYSDYFNFSLNPAVKQNRRMLERIFSKVESCNLELAQLRAIKQPSEIAAMKKAIKLTTDTFAQVRANIDSFQTEYEVEAAFTYSFRKKGYGHAYEPIVAAGNNACTLHYTKNKEKLLAKQLVLIDIGARVDSYCADITRTYAIGTITKRQQQIHSAVEAAHRRIIRLIQPGKSIEEYQKEVETIMSEALEQLELTTSLDDGMLRKYFPHAVSHGLGIDTHDSLGKPKYFEENMVITVEPGIYIPEEKVGVRIEDNILVTGTGRTNLSASLSTGV